LQDKIRFKDQYGPATELPLDQRYEAGELGPEDQELWEAYEESEESRVMDVDVFFAEEALTSHIASPGVSFGGGGDSDDDLPI
jgi:hypothetical protein